MNDNQREVTAILFIDTAKTLLIVFIIGGFVPNANISIQHVIISIIVSLSLYIDAMRILRGYKNG